MVQAVAPRFQDSATACLLRQSADGREILEVGMSAFSDEFNLFRKQAAAIEHISYTLCNLPLRLQHMRQHLHIFAAGLSYMTDVPSSPL